MWLSWNIFLCDRIEYIHVVGWVACIIVLEDQEVIRSNGNEFTFLLWFSIYYINIFASLIRMFAGLCLSLWMGKFTMHRACHRVCLLTGLIYLLHRHNGYTTARYVFVQCVGKTLFNFVVRTRSVMVQPVTQSLCTDMQEIPMSVGTYIII